MFKGASAWFTNSGIWDSTVSARPWACAGVLARASAHVHSASAMAIGPCMVFQLAMRAIEAPSPDRKSTRLNSSHLVISYAVFCLKKKKKRKDEHHNNY